MSLGPKRKTEVKDNARVLDASYKKNLVIIHYDEGDWQEEIWKWMEFRISL